MPEAERNFNIPFFPPGDAAYVEYCERVEKAISSGLPFQRVIAAANRDFEKTLFEAALKRKRSAARFR